MAEAPAPAATHLEAPHAGACANCGTALVGRWCHACGQREDAHHRSVLHLGAEALEGPMRGFQARGRIVTVLCNVMPALMTGGIFTLLLLSLALFSIGTLRPA